MQELVKLPWETIMVTLELPRVVFQCVLRGLNGVSLRCEWHTVSGVRRSIRYLEIHCDPRFKATLTV